jgi:hypothetical protein
VFKISVKRLTFGNISFPENNVFTYDGTEHVVEVVGDIPANAIVTYLGSNSFINAGTYDLSAVISCEGYVTAKLSTTVKIERARYDMSGVQFEAKEFVYDGISYTVLEWTIKWLNEVKKRRLNEEKKYETLQSLKYSIEDVFTYFQEAAGPDVDEFWRLIKEANLPYERENKLEKIMTRGRIRNDIEYDYVIDTIVPFQQEGILSNEDVKKLNEMIEKFERKRR